MIKTIIFDNGGVLVEDTWLSFLKDISQEMHVSIEDFNKLINEPISKALIGKQAFKDFTKEISAITNNSKYLKELKTLAKKKKEIIAIAYKLKQRYRLAMLTNDLGTFRKDNKFWGLEKIFENNIFCSSEIGSRKPDIEAFKFVIKKLKIKPAETVFIDDKGKNVTVAESLGINGIIFKNKKQFLKELNLLGVTIK